MKIPVISLNTHSKPRATERASLQRMIEPRNTETAAHLLSLDYPAEFKPGAISAVTTCLRISPSEKVTLITDRVTEPIAAALAAQLAECGCSWDAFVLEDLA